MILGKPIVAKPPSACTETYLVVDVCSNKKEAYHLAEYISTRFFRFLVGLVKNTQNISKKVFCLVPVQDWSESWTDDKLYKKYNLTQDEIDFIESMIRPMELNNG
jgi:site-specific DNA-methyltransferase (adenine-specific)